MNADRLANESPEYRKARAELLEAEIALKDERERVAELRRRLPPGPVVERDYVFREGPADLGDASEAGHREVRLSELFEGEGRPLILVHFMYGGAQESPCPMCSMWADGYHAVARHLRRKAEIAVVAEAGIRELRAWGRERGWRNLRFLSSQGNGFKTDFRMQGDDGAQHPGVSVFTRDPDAAVRHFYTGEALMAEGHFRGMDLLCPVWHFFDLLPEGRGDWFPSLSQA